VKSFEAKLQSMKKLQNQSPATKRKPEIHDLWAVEVTSTLFSAALIITTLLILYTVVYYAT